MTSVEFGKIAPGTCIWCGKEKDEVVHVAFSDKSFSGPMCFADFKKALRMKCGTPGEKKATPGATTPAASAAPK